MTSLMLEPMDGLPTTAALPGQFVVVRLGVALGAPPLMRSYSLSGEPGACRYRISVSESQRAWRAPTSQRRYKLATCWR